MPVQLRQLTPVTSGHEERPGGDTRQPWGLTGQDGQGKGGVHRAGGADRSGSNKGPGGQGSADAIYTALGVPWGHVVGWDAGE